MGNVETRITDNFVPVEVGYASSAMKVIIFTQFVTFIDILEATLTAIGFNIVFQELL